MSKIYEALLRAELERTLGVGENAPEVTDARTLQSLLTPELTTLPADETPSETDPQEVPSHLAQEFVESDAGPTPTDFSLVAARPWVPVPAYLPALDERGPHVEQFRSLRSHVMEFRDTTHLKSILVCSGLPAEGKSFISLNLALSFSRHKSNRVLLIDGDMRRSSLHKALGTTQEPGLTEFLSGEKNLLEVLQRCKVSNETQSLHPGLASLTFLPAGRITDNAGDLAANPRFAELISDAATYFDWIFVDSSPVNLVSDAVSLSRACDGVLLVAREAVTRFKTAQQAQAQFKNGNILGVVLNAVHTLPVKGDYYGDYDNYKSEA